MSETSREERRMFITGRVPLHVRPVGRPFLSLPVWDVASSLGHQVRCAGTVSSQPTAPMRVCVCAFPQKRHVVRVMFVCSRFQKEDGEPVDSDVEIYEDY